MNHTLPRHINRRARSRARTGEGYFRSFHAPQSAGGIGGEGGAWREGHFWHLPLRRWCLQMTTPRTPCICSARASAGRGPTPRTPCTFSSFPFPPPLRKRACALDQPRAAQGPLPRIPQGLGGVGGPFRGRFAAAQRPPMGLRTPGKTHFFRRIGARPCGDLPVLPACPHLASAASHAVSRVQQRPRCASSPPPCPFSFSPASAACPSAPESARRLPLLLARHRTRFRRAASAPAQVPTRRKRRQVPTRRKRARTGAECFVGSVPHPYGPYRGTGVRDGSGTKHSAPCMPLASPSVRSSGARRPPPRHASRTDPERGWTLWPPTNGWHELFWVSARCMAGGGTDPTKHSAPAGALAARRNRVR